MFIQLLKKQLNQVSGAKGAVEERCGRINEELNIFIEKNKVIKFTVNCKAYGLPRSVHVRFKLYNCKIVVEKPCGERLLMYVCMYVCMYVIIGWKH